MDPLSIAASVVALITAARSTIRFLEKVKSHSQGNVEVLYILNAISHVVFVLQVVLNDVEDLKKELSSPAFNVLPTAINKVGNALRDLDFFLRDSLINSSGKLSFTRWSGVNRVKLETLKQAVDDMRRNLDTIIGSANLRALPLLQGAIESIKVLGRSQEELSAKMDQAIHQLATGLPPTSSSGNPLADRSSILSDTTTMIDPDGSIISATENRDPSLVCIKTSVPAKRCSPLCTCQCHARSSGRSPQWLAMVFGSMFYCSAGSLQAGRRSCDRIDCLQATGSKSHVTYYFPTWLVQGSLSFSTWNNLKGTNSSWTINMPRLIPDSARCWDLIRLGKIEEIRGLLERREMSPYDVASDGVSVLRLAAGALQYGVCALLAQHGAPWMLKDRAGRSAADLVWEAILLYGAINKDVPALQPLLRQVEDDIDLKISPLHRIVSGQALLSLEGYLDVDTSDIDSQDWLGKTPLMWASHKGDLTAVTTLLRYHAKINMRDAEGKTCLHYAAIGGHPSVVKALIDAGADARITERFSALPLHAAVLSTNKSVEDFTAMAKHLIDAGCDLEHENYRPFTPIFYAVNFDNAAYLEALINLNANFNRYSVGMCMTPLSLAIYHDRLNALSVLVKHNAASSWPSDIKASERDETKKLRAELNDILQMSAVYASVEAMQILSQSDLEAVIYDPTRIWDLFSIVRLQHGANNRDDDMFATETALRELLSRKGVAISSIEIVDGTIVTEDFVGKMADVKIENCDEIFVDAIEVQTYSTR